MNPSTVPGVCSLLWSHLHRKTSVPNTNQEWPQAKQLNDAHDRASWSSKCEIKRKKLAAFPSSLRQKLWCPRNTTETSKKDLAPTLFDEIWWVYTVILVSFPRTSASDSIFPVCKNEAWTHVTAEARLCNPKALWHHPVVQTKASKIWASKQCR